MSAGYHVHPVADIVEHELTDDCACGPSPVLVQTDHGDEWIVVHEALDGRP